MLLHEVVVHQVGEVGGLLLGERAICFVGLILLVISFDGCDLHGDDRILAGLVIEAQCGEIGCGLCEYIVHVVVALAMGFDLAWLDSYLNLPAVANESLLDLLEEGFRCVWLGVVASWLSP